MALAISTYSIILDTNVQNTEFKKHLMQGSTDSIFEISVLKDGGISTAKLADDSVTAAKVNSDVAGTGLTQNVSGALDVNVDNSTLEISSDTVQVADGGITQTKLDSTLEAKIVNGYAETVGDGSATSFTITHNLGTYDVMIGIYKVSTGECVACNTIRTSTNAISVGAFPAPASNDLRVLVQKIITT